MGRQIPPSPPRCPVPACGQPAAQPIRLSSWVRRVSQGFAALSCPHCWGMSGSLLVGARCLWERLAPWVLALMLSPLFAPHRTHRSLASNTQRVTLKGASPFPSTSPLKIILSPLSLHPSLFAPGMAWQEREKG